MRKQEKRQTSNNKILFSENNSIFQLQHTGLNQRSHSVFDDGDGDDTLIYT